MHNMCVYIIHIHIMVIIIIHITFMTYKYGKYISYTLWYTYKDSRVLQDAYIILCITRTSSCIAGDVGRTTIITICPFTSGRRLKRYTISAARRIGTYNTCYRYIIRMRHENNNRNLYASVVRLSEIGKIATKAVGSETNDASLLIIRAIMYVTRCSPYYRYTYYSIKSDTRILILGTRVYLHLNNNIISSSLRGTS